MRKFLLDGGTHLGQGLKQIMRQHAVDNLWNIHTWEANPYTWAKYQEKNTASNIHSYNQALSDHDGTITVNIETAESKYQKGLAPIGQGTSILDLDRWQAGPHIGVFNEQCVVPCINFAAWIQTNCAPEDFIVCKLDIEGAEYQVLNQMNQLGVLSWIDHLYVEWHATMINDQELLEQEHKLREDIKSLGIALVEWH
jgi:FkbM family methyltransferase